MWTCFGTLCFGNETGTSANPFVQRELFPSLERLNPGSWKFENQTQNPANQVQTKSQRLTPEPTVRTRSRDKCPLFVPVNLKAWKTNVRAATLSIYRNLRHIYKFNCSVETHQAAVVFHSSNMISRFGFHCGLSS